MANSIPDSLEKLLNVVPRAGGTTSAVEPSRLLGKLDKFLPQLKAANSQLDNGCDAHKLNSIPAPKLVPKSADGGTERDADGDEEMDDPLAVNMDVYVDESQGELVADGAARPKDAKPLIEVVEDGEKKNSTTS